MNSVPTTTDAEPIVEELRPAPDPLAVFLRLAGRKKCLFLDSALRDADVGRYSFITADPFQFLELPWDGPNAWNTLRGELAKYTANRLTNLPPFQGGAAGLFSYDLARQLERLPGGPIDEFHVPGLAVGLYDVVVAFDHVTDRAWIISQGFPETEPVPRRRRARQRMAEFQRWLCEDETLLERLHISEPPIDVADLVPQFSVPGPQGLTSNLDRREYLRRVERAVQYVMAGDIFQVNLSQRLLYPAHDSTAEFYLRLRRRNAAPFAAYFDLGNAQIASASPERFLRVVEGKVETRPIKGTRQRTIRPEADLFSGDELLESEKDRAENVMIVDLLRNDLSRVCRPETVRVPELCRLESYAYVQHLVSIVTGLLAPSLGPLDALQAAFPGGSITGAPKVRAMQIIDELEPTVRGAYCGALGYVGFDGSMDTSILIRTVTAAGGWWQAPVGGGIVAQSDPRREYEETWHKAAGILQAFEA